MVDGSASASELSKRYGLNRKTITGWANKIRAGGVLEETVGRPHVLDTISIQRVMQATQINNLQNRAMPRREFDELIRSEAESTQLPKNRALKSPPCAQTIKTIRKDLRCRCTKKASTTTDARTREEADPRNMLLEAAMLQAFQSGLPKSHVINLDAQRRWTGE